jgi:hypothetical protein
MCAAEAVEVCVCGVGGGVIFLKNNLWITNHAIRLPVLFPFDRHFCSEMLPFLVRFFTSNREIILLSRDRRKDFVSSSVSCYLRCNLLNLYSVEECEPWRQYGRRIAATKH